MRVSSPPIVVYRAKASGSVCTVTETRHAGEVAKALWEPMSSDLLISFGGEVSIAEVWGNVASSSFNSSGSDL